MAIPPDMLLHPELLTNEQLRLIIQERQLRIPNMENMGRDELLHLFHSYCVPYGQRKYRDSGRGKMLNKARQMSPDNRMKMDNNQGRKLSPPWQCERLKPPPDVTAGHQKTIKIKTLFTPIIDTFNAFKRKISIECVPPATDSPPPKRSRTAITWP